MTGKDPAVRGGPWVESPLQGPCCLPFHPGLLACFPLAPLQSRHCPPLQWLL